MVPILMVWLYLALIFSVSQLPDKVAMLTTFVITGAIPLFLMFRILTGKRDRERQARVETKELPVASVQVGVRDENHQHAGKD